MNEELRKVFEVKPEFAGKHMVNIDRLFLDGNQTWITLLLSSNFIYSPESVKFRIEGDTAYLAFRTYFSDEITRIPDGDIKIIWKKEEITFPDALNRKVDYIVKDGLHMAVIKLDSPIRQAIVLENM